MSRVRDLPEITSLADNDLLYAVDTSEGPTGGRKVTIETLTAKISSEINAEGVEYKRNIFLRKDIQTSSGTVELALDDLDDNKLSRTGNQPMLGNLDMDSNNILNAGSINGVVIENHGTRHDPGSDDPITTASAVGLSATTANTEGTAGSVARSDHTHAISTAAAITQTPDQTNAVGTSSSLARADHVHNIPTASAISLSAATSNTTGTAGTFARSDHTHSIASGVVVTQNADQTNAAGTSANFARADHIHNIPTAVPVSTGTANAQGTANTFAKSDHVHATVISNSSVTATGTTTSTSTTEVLIAGMTLTPSAGTYYVSFSTSAVNSGTGALRFFVSIYVDGTIVDHSERSLGSTGGVVQTVHTHAVVTVNGSQTIEARWRAVAGTNTAYARSLTAIRLS